MNEIICLSGVELLMEYLEGTLPPDVRAAIDVHVAGCPRCVAFITSYEATPRVVREATAIAMPADLESSLLDAVRKRRDKTRDGE